jgi:hypothetical protein
VFLVGQAEVGCAEASQRAEHLVQDGEGEPGVLLAGQGAESVESEMVGEGGDVDEVPGLRAAKQDSDAMVQVDTGHLGARAYPTIGRSFIDSIAAGGPVVIDPGPHAPTRPRQPVPALRPSPLPPTPPNP